MKEDSEVSFLVKIRNCIVNLFVFSTFMIRLSTLSGDSVPTSFVVNVSKLNLRKSRIEVLFFLCEISYGCQLSRAKKNDAK